VKRSNFLLFIIVLYSVTAGIMWFTSVKTSTIYPDKDSYSWQSVPNANNWNSNNFEIASYYKPPYNMRGWMEFNLSSIPSDALVTSAVFRLRVWYIGNTTGRVYGVYRLLQPWKEQLVNWANQPNSTDQDHAESPVPKAPYGWANGAWDDPRFWMGWDVSGIMRDWRSGVSNYGLVVRDTHEYASAFYTTQFFTHDQVPDQSYYPKLEVTYVLPRNLPLFGIALVAEGLFIIAYHRLYKVKESRSKTQRSM
jgi:hypothetical protein